VQKNIDVDLALIDYYDRVIRDLDHQLMTATQPHDPQTLARLRSVPGIGPIFSLVLLYEIHDIHRFPRVQDFASYCRVVKCAHESAGERYGTSGHHIGHVHLKWAFSEAAVLFLVDNPPGQKYYERLEKTYGPGKALTVLAHKLARAVYAVLKRQTTFDMDIFMRG
jgi:transposase